MNYIILNREKIIVKYSKIIVERLIKHITMIISFGVEKTQSRHTVSNYTDPERGYTKLAI